MSALPEHLVAQWHPSKNGDLQPSDVTHGSRRVVWWLCSNGHEWEAAIRTRSKSKVSACVKCGKHVRDNNDLVSRSPELILEWHPTKNGDLQPTQVSYGSQKKVWWLCSNGHEWEADVKSRVRGAGCAECRWVIKGVNDLVTMNPEIAAEWHPTRNGDLKPDEVGFGSMKKVWWLCSNGHEWKTSVNHRASKKRGCAVCAGQRVISGYNDLSVTHVEFRELWHPTKNGNLAFEDFSAGSQSKVWWLGVCGHEWEAIIKDVLGKHSSCPICSGRKVLLGYNDLASQCPTLAAQWHPTKNGDLKPHEISSGSHLKVWWLGECGHEWEAAVYSRVTGNGCRFCALKSSGKEKALLDFIETLGVKVERNDRSLLQGKELDGYLPDHKVAIEFNGIFWHDEGHKGKTYHYDKWLACKALGVQLIQIWEDEWVNNPELVKKMIMHKLGLNHERKLFARKTFVQQLMKPEVEGFLKENHIQGYSSGSYYLGLKTVKEEELVAVLVLKKEPNTDGRSLNIIRYATSCSVVGGFTKLLKYVEKTYHPDSLITFSDHCVSDGGLYQNNGFVADKELLPDYRYVVNGKREHKFQYRIKRFKNDSGLEYRKDLSERQLAELNNLKRIWDAGKTRWVLTFRNN